MSEDYFLHIRLSTGNFFYIYPSWLGTWGQSTGSGMIQQPGAETGKGLIKDPTGMDLAALGLKTLSVKPLTSERYIYNIYIAFYYYFYITQVPKCYMVCHSGWFIHYIITIVLKNNYAYYYKESSVSALCSSHVEPWLCFILYSED